jgi:hypothetical protein
MKKYKLIKRYPGSPKLNFIVTFKPGYDHVSPAKTESGTDYCYLHLDECEEFFENWEEIVEPTYEILSIKSVDKRRMYIQEWTSEKESGKSLEQMLTLGRCVESGDYYINSVKRLADGAVFNVKDTVSHSHSVPNLGIVTTDYIIEKIYFVTKDKLLFYVGSGLNLGISNMIKAKKPLFTTKDGVEIFEETNYVWLTTEDYKISPNVVVILPFTGFHNKVLTFSTTAAAEKYVKFKTTVLFKTQDGVDIFEGDKYYKVLDFTAYYISKAIAHENVASEVRLHGRGLFSTKEAAEEYIMMSRPFLSIQNVMDILGINENWKLIDKLKAFYLSK